MTHYSLTCRHLLGAASLASTSPGLHLEAKDPAAVPLSLTPSQQKPGLEQRAETIGPGPVPCSAPVCLSRARGLSLGLLLCVPHLSPVLALAATAGSLR